MESTTRLLAKITMSSLNGDKIGKKLIIPLMLTTCLHSSVVVSSTAITLAPSSGYFNTLFIALLNMTPFLQELDSKINAQRALEAKRMSLSVYADSSKKAFALLDKAYKKKRAKYESDFEAKQLARQNAAAQHALLASARYNELNEKAYQMGLATHKKLAGIQDILNTPIDQRKTYKAGVKIGRAKYKLDASNRGANMQETVTSETESTISLTKESLIRADQVKDENELNL